MTKYCSGCSRKRPESQFSWKNKAAGRRQSRCRTCQASAQADWYQRNKSSHKASVSVYNKRLREEKRTLVRNIKESTPCTDCGRLGHFAAMDFDHLSDKKFNISRLTSSAMTMKALLKEIAKCEVVCAYCHRIRTYERQLALAAA